MAEQLITDDAEVYGKACGEYRAPLMAKLNERQTLFASSHTRASRALDLLRKHPEFEELEELRELVRGLGI